MQFFPSRICSVIVLLSVFPTPNTRAEIDLTPIPGERVVEGFTYKHLIFFEQGRRITYSPPKGWTYTGTSQAIRFLPPGLAQAQAEIQQSPISGPQGPRGSAGNPLKSQALASLPKDSYSVTIVAETQNPLQIDGHGTYEITVAYELFNQAYQMSVLFANLPDTHLRFRLIARKQDFDSLSQLFRTSLYSWRSS